MSARSYKTSHGVVAPPWKARSWTTSTGLDNVPLTWRADREQPPGVIDRSRSRSPPPRPVAFLAKADYLPHGGERAIRLACFATERDRSSTVTARAAGPPESTLRRPRSRCRRARVRQLPRGLPLAGDAPGVLNRGIEEAGRPTWSVPRDALRRYSAPRPCWSRSAWSVQRAAWLPASRFGAADRPRAFVDLPAGRRGACSPPRLTHRRHVRVHFGRHLQRACCRASAGSSRSASERSTDCPRRENSAGPGPTGRALRHAVSDEPSALRRRARHLGRLGRSGASAVRSPACVTRRREFGLALGEAGDYWPLRS